MRVGKPQTFFSQLIDMGCLDPGGAITAKIPITQVIGIDNDHIGCLIGCLTGWFFLLRARAQG
jgi:hypothetical protein